MRKILIALLWLVSLIPAHAQLTQSQVNTVISTDIPSCGTGCITGAQLRNVLGIMNQATFQSTQFPNSWTALQTFSGGAAVIGANTAGLTTDFGSLVVQNSATTASGVYSGVNPFLWSDGVRSTVVIPNGTTVGAGTAFGGYVLNQQASSGQTKNGVLYWGQGISAVDNAKTWGFNPGLNDTTNNASTATSGRTLVGIEFDCTLATNNAGSSCQGAQMTIAGLFGEQHGGNAFQAGAAFPASPANAEANAHWTNTFVSPDGVTMGAGANQGAALIVGSIVRHTAGTASSQTILFNRWNSGTEVQDSLTDGGTGLLTWGGTAYLGNLFIAIAAAITTGAGQIAYGGTTVAAGANTCPTGTVGGQTVQGCEVHNVAGTTRYVPFF